MTIQITIIRIEGYGPWTLSLGSDREASLQMLQAKIYYDLQRLFSESDCLVYANRFDEYFAISNGLSIEDHLMIQKELEMLHDTINLSMAVGRGRTPFEANVSAYRARKASKVLNRSCRIFGKMSLHLSTRNQSLSTNNNKFVQIMHVDVNNSTDLSSKLSPYEFTTLVSKIYLRLSQQFLKKGAMTFFIGGDNFMVISNGTSKEDAKKIISMVTKATGIKLNCGIGIGRTGRRAAEAATRALDTVRSMRKMGKSRSFYEIEYL